MSFSPVPKPDHKRRKPKKGNRGKFSAETRKAVIERDEGLCRVCRAPAGEIHHVMFKSRSGRGVYTNGLLVCQTCHSAIHASGDKTEFWQKLFERVYGPDYYKDSYDI